MRVLGCGRRRPSDLRSIAAHYPLDRLDALLAECDFVILSIVLTPETTGLIDARRLSLMRRDAVLVNLARGPVVDERALYEARTGGTIAGAVIDVWWRYRDATDPNPRLSADPFHALPNVTMTPHSS